MSELSERNTLFDEWDASLECGSGVICVSGPSGCGKTHSLLHYLMLRECTLQNKNSYDYSTNSERERTNKNDLQQTDYQSGATNSYSSSSSSRHNLCKENNTAISECQEQLITSRTSARTTHNIRSTVCKVVLVSAKCVLTPSEALARFTETIECDCNRYYNQLHHSGSDLEFTECQWPHQSLRHRKRQLHRRHSVNALLFGQCVHSWQLLHTSDGGGELHCILDDADAFHDESIEQELSLWWQGCEYSMCAPYATKRSRVEENNTELDQEKQQECLLWCKKRREPKIVLWIVSQLPLRIAGCFRYHILRAPSSSCIVQWITNHFKERHEVQQRKNRDSVSENTLRNYALSDQHSNFLDSANDIEQCVLESVKYYTMHQPMRSSLITHDIRLLLHRVYALLPLLMKEVLLQKRQQEQQESRGPCHLSEVEQLPSSEEKLGEFYTEEEEETSSIMTKQMECTSMESNLTVKLNALHFARAWSQYITNLQTTLQSSSSATSAQSTIAATRNSKEILAHEENKNVSSEHETSTNVHLEKEATTTKEQSENKSKLDLLQCIDKPQVSDPIVQSLSALGYSAILLAFTSFYCGAVPRSKISDVLGTFADSRTHGHGKRKRRSTFSTNTSRRSVAARVRSETTTQSHKASVLTSSAQAISCEWLLTVYNSLLQIVIQQIDPLEFVCASVVVHVINTFVKWGLLVHLVHGRVISPSAMMLPLSSESSFRCFIPVTTALVLGEMLSINLYELIPS